MVKSNEKIAFSNSAKLNKPQVRGTKSTLTPKTEIIINRFEREGFPDGVASSNTIITSPYCLFFYDSPIRFIEKEDSLYYSTVDILSAIQFFEKKHSRLMEVALFNTWMETQPELASWCQRLAWRPHPNHRFFWNVECLDTEGVFFMLDYFKTDQTEAFRTWFSEVLAEKTSA